MKKCLTGIITVLALSLIMISCGTKPPEGFEAAEQKAMEAQSLAIKAQGETVLPLEYEAAEAVLKTALAEKEQKNYETAFTLFQQAEQKFTHVARMVPLKLESDKIMDEAEANINSINDNLNLLIEDQEKE